MSGTLRRVLSLVVWTPAFILASCYSASPKDGLPCSESMQCPDGQMCDPESLVCYEHPPAALELAQIAAGADHTCGIDPEGALYCWGRNLDGQLGLGDGNDRTEPARVGTDSDWIAIAAGENGTCGIRGTQQLFCWGQKVDVGMTSNKPVEVPNALGWGSVYVGGDLSCAIDGANTVWCHVYDDDGWTQVSGPAATNAVAVASDFGHACVIDSTNTLSCWGDNNTGALGDGTQNVRDSNNPYVHPGTWTQVVMRDGHTCALATDGHLWCWGECDQDQATGDEGPGAGYCLSPSQIGTDTYDRITAGEADTCAIRSDGLMVCFGRNLEGQLGQSTIGQRSTPVVLPRFNSWKAVAAGGRHVCAIRDSGDTWCWGHDRYGQLGDGEASLHRAPEQVDAGPWESVSTGLSFTCGIRSNHSAWCWGENGAGQLGNGTTDRSSIPIDVKDAAVYQKVVAGGQHACGLKMDGTLWCWGDNRDGQLGIGNLSNTTENEPTQVGTQTSWTNVAVGNADTLAVSSTGLYSWGDYGQEATPTQLSTNTSWKAIDGNGYNDDILGGMLAVDDNDVFYFVGSTVLTPLDPVYTGTGSPNFTMVADGRAHSCGISATEGGSMVCWGQNYFGELGATAPDQKTMVTVGGGLTWKWVDAGEFGTCGITASGAGTPDELYCWGAQELVPADLTGEGIMTPQRIAAGQRWKSVSISDHHGCGVAMDGALWCWGDNLAGELGGGPTSKNAPVRVHAVPN